MSILSKISINNIHKSFGNKKILQGISFDVSCGESLVILGGSGNGKSVCIKAIANLINIDSGEIKIDNINIKQKKDFYQKIGFLFQGSALFDSMNIWQNIALNPLHIKKINPETAKKNAIQQLESVDLEADVAEKFPHELSGGMQKRVALARATINNPEILLLDEPTTGLDPISSEIINNLIIRKTKEIKCSTIIITHDLHSALKISNKIAFINEGKIAWIGNTSEIANSSNDYIKKYLKSSGFSKIFK